MSKLETNTIDTVSGTSTLQVGSTNTSTITLGVSGDTINVPSGVTINNNGTQTGFGGTNTPNFLVRRSGTQTTSADTWTKVQLNNEVYDSSSAFDSSTNYRFTVPSGQGGTYKFYTTLNFDDNQNAEKIGFRQLYFYKNGSSHAFFYNDNGTSKAISSNWGSGNVTMVLNASDYVEVYAAIGQTASASPEIQGYSSGNRYSVFGGYKIIR